MSDHTAPQHAVGWIGLGQMGLPMVERLIAAQIPILATDIDRGLRDRIPSTSWVDTVAEVAGRSTLIVTMLPNGAVVRDVVAGPNGLLAHALRGTLIADMSSCAPGETLDLAAAAARYGVTVIDAPVSGGVKGARAGSLTVMTGGDPVEISRLEPVLAVVADRVFACGRTGAGHAMKALNNLLSCIGLVATAEVLAIGSRFGLDGDTMIDVLNASSGANFATERKIKQFVLSGTYDSGFVLDLLTKDVHNALTLASDTGVTARLGTLCADLADQALADWGNVDHTRLTAWIDEHVAESSLGSEEMLAQ